jgi:urease accessory protein UreF
MNKQGQINTPTADFIKSMREISLTLNSSFTALLSASVRLAEVGQNQEAMGLIELAEKIQCAEAKVRLHAKDAGIGKIVKLSEH